MAEDENGENGENGEEPGELQAPHPGRTVDPEAEANQILQYLDAIKARMDTYGQQGEMLQNALEDNVRAQEALKAMATAKPGDEALVPVGGGAFIRASTGDTSTVLVSLGRGIWADMDRAAALERLDGRFEELRKSQDAILDGIEGLRQQAAGLQARLEELSGGPGSLGLG
jgi:prefoldin alpha subunit